MKTPTPYLIEWEDSSSPSPNGWVFLESRSSDKLCRCITVGFIIDRNEKSITVAQTIDPEDKTVTGRITIPTAVIRRKRRLKV